MEIDAWAPQLLTQLTITSDPQSLYDAEILSGTLLTYAARLPDLTLLEALANLYESSLPYLATYADGSCYWPADPTVWVFDESILCSCRFLWGCSRLVRAIRALPFPSEYLLNFAGRMTIVILSHLQRWVFGDSVPGRGPFEVWGWGCADGGDYNHSDMIDRQMARSLGESPGYCNAVCDWDLLIPAIVAEMRPTDGQWLDYLNRATALFQSRTVGAVFDPGAWDDHPEYAYTGYTSETFPTIDQVLSAQGVGWDVGHGQCFFECFTSLYEAHYTSWPTADVLTAFAQRILDHLWNQDIVYPRFANFWDGTNGWYRVGYHGGDFGYYPGALSSAILTGGYLFWSEFCPALWDLGQHLRAMYNSSDPTVLQHISRYYVAYGSDPAWNPLLFLPSLLQMVK